VSSNIWATLSNTASTCRIFSAISAVSVNLKRRLAMSRNLRIEELILGVQVVFAFVGGSTFFKKKLKGACGGNDVRAPFFRLLLPFPSVSFVSPHPSY
jgi:hypothetical protein